MAIQFSKQEMREEALTFKSLLPGDRARLCQQGLEQSPKHIRCALVDGGGDEVEVGAGLVLDAELLEADHEGARIGSRLQN